MGIFVDSVETNRCEPIFFQPSNGKNIHSSRKSRRKTCVVDLSLLDSINGTKYDLSFRRFQRGESREVNFVLEGRSRDARLDFKHIQEKGWEIPKEKIQKAIYINFSMRSFLDVKILDPFFKKDLLFDFFNRELLAFLSFGNIEQPDPKYFNSELNHRMVWFIYHMRTKYPEQWSTFIKNYLNPLQKDHKITLEEKKRIQWVFDVDHTIVLLGNDIPKSKAMPGMGDAILQLTHYLFSPAVQWKEFARDKTIREAVIVYHQYNSHRAEAEREKDLFIPIQKALSEAGEKLTSFKTNLILQARLNRLRAIIDKAVEDKLAYLISLRKPKDALLEGLVQRYGKNPAGKEIMQIFTKHIGIVFTGKENKPSFVLKMEDIYKDIVERVESRSEDTRTYHEMLRFVSEVLLGKLLADGNNMEIFLDGYFQERVNFYPSLALSSQRVAWQRLIDWTKNKIKTEELDIVEPHTLLNKSGLVVDSGLLLAGGVSAALLWKKEPWRDVSMTIAGTGLGAGFGNLICYLLDISNPYYLCDIIGGIGGGFTTGLIMKYVPYGETTAPVVEPPPNGEPPKPDPPGPEDRFPVDPFGP